MTEAWRLRLTRAQEVAARFTIAAVRVCGGVVKAWGGAAEMGRDAHIYGGGTLLSIGAHHVYPPAGFLAFGALLVYIGLRRP